MLNISLVFKSGAQVGVPDANVTWEELLRRYEDPVSKYLEFDGHTERREVIHTRVLKEDILVLSALEQFSHVVPPVGPRRG